MSRNHLSREGATEQPFKIPFTRKRTIMSNNKLKITSAVFATAALLRVSVVHAQGIPHELEDLKARVASLEATVSALEAQVATIQSNHSLLLGPFVNVDPNPEAGVIGPNIVFSGANIHIVSGTGATNDNGNPTGLGNLIIGYDEDPTVLAALPLSPGDRGGSHNLVIGRANRFTLAAFGGLVAGEVNTISNSEASVTGGRGNTASGSFASVSGGLLNSASGFEASVSGGARNFASGGQTSVTGGLSNTATASQASVSGGLGNTASGFQASVSGGSSNTASGDEASSVSGGRLNIAGGLADSSVSGGLQNTATGLEASVIGGTGNTAGGQGTVVIGGQGTTDNNSNSIAP